ncbi:T9SS type A sorting domain-containing protein [Lacinutrix sp. C3R15]|uniref:alpha-amylase family glycosyl hydrolase n=1 Tax=Flavobacteriaceae TaxID=49546 RepID=UPI001C0815F0|nr:MULTISPECIES: alpha-amylase family glycosyl hydrolase [Flavobacteriaceae]MBU2939106.1 T9SS type A sorting domain-containing protein [Lacinutrix sp. C3R15]MDO6622421.1 alpha-amylase family glycosyl hydrolase [Oceanihabitans sp. 1_MG-2023]
MKKLLLLTLLLSVFSSYAQLSWQGGTTPEDTDSATLLFDKTGTGLDTYTGTIYAHTGVTIDDSTDWQNVIGSWGDNASQPALTLVSGNIYKLDLTTTIRNFYSYSDSGTITAINIVLRSDDGTQQTTDLSIEVGSFQVTMINPSDSNSTIVVNSGANTQILAQNTNGNADYELKANGTTINTSTTSFYNYFISNITENLNCELIVTQGSATVSKYFSILVNNTQNQAIPSGLENGINYTSNTTATLVLEAPNKDFVYVAGSFNDWNPDASYAMKKDTASDKFWLELTGLTPNEIETYQYWVVDQSPITNSPTMVKTADPFSTLVLSPFDDPWISETTYPNLPAYPAGQEFEVTVLQTGQDEYNWLVTDFEKPKKEDLVIYEVLIRDFDADRNFQDLIDKIDYFKNLNVNAIQLMPVMEFEGNESWGYNTSFHLALDKFYGTEEKFKEFIDLCHQNGIAVILDVALNHAFGRNPMNRMWMDDADGDGWGEPSTENPYFNTTAMHSYSVGSDFNHQSTYTQYYTERVIKHWIEEFKIDGLRWDLTKGFTQNAEGSETNTNAYQADRVAILKEYADYSWSLDETHYVIFEHLGFGGSAQEETEWANYRLNESVAKGIMLWGKLTEPYNQLTMGYNSDNNIDAMGHVNRGFDAPRLVGYAESHDEERLMYKNLQYGNASNSAHNVTDLNTALSRMSALGAVSLTIPGPKMIWHFGELGMENSIFTCNNGTVNDTSGTDGDCKLDTKPQPQWVENWESDAIRSQIYSDWSRINELKINEPVFEGDYTITSGNLTPRIDIYDTSIPTTALRNVIVLANFDVVSQTINTSFPSGITNTWYDLMDETGNTTISNATTTITIPAGQFRIFGNQSSTLSTDAFEYESTLSLYPNPTSSSFQLNKDITSLKIFDVSGKLVQEYYGSYSKNTSFDVSSLAQGLYIVKIESNTASVSKRLILN